MSGAEMFEPVELAELDQEGKQRLERLFYHCNTLLGGSSIPVHLEKVDYMLAFESALHMYRTRSSRSVNQTFGFLKLEPNKSQYTLHDRIDVVKKIERGGGVLGGGAFESFGAATANTILRGATGGAGAIDLVTYDFLAQYQETLSRVFATTMNFHYRNENNTLVIYQPPTTEETVLLEISVLKTVTELLNDHWSYEWLQKYTLAVSKTILGEIYSLITSPMPGPQGGTTLKGDQLKQAGEQEKEKLEDDLLVFGDSSDIPLPIRG